MTRLFMPALYLMSKLSFRQKFILISALFMVPLLGYVYLLSTQMSIDSQVAQYHDKLTQAEKDAILWRNLERLLGI